jgi:hypothetical protein
MFEPGDNIATTVAMESAKPGGKPDQPVIEYITELMREAHKRKVPIILGPEATETFYKLGMDKKLPKTWQGRLVTDEGSKAIKDVPKTLEKRKEFFNEEIAQAQRGAPETKMVELQFIAGGGPISYVSERVGDLTNRIYGSPQKYSGRQWAWEATKEKIDKSLHELTSKYGFQREVSENAISNAKFEGIPLAEYQRKVDKALKEYADAHRNLPVYNEVQRLANEAAVAFGEKNFDLTTKNLQILKGYMDEGFESWEKRVYQLDNP